MHNLDTRELDFFLKNKVEELKLAGVAVGIRGPEGVLFEQGYGFRDKEMTTPPDGNTIFGIASMSKSTAALACAILAAEGKLSLEDPVSKYVPGFHVPGNPDDAVTIRSLAMHTTGIPPMEPLEWSIAMNTPGRTDEETLQLKAASPNQMDKIEQVIDYIANCPYPTLGAPGEYMSYSNEGYAVLNYVVDAAAGMTLEEFLDQRVFGPLGMTRTTLDVDGSQARALAAEDGNISSLFEKHEDKWVADDTYSTLPPFRACACVKSTVHDMARYYQCLSNDGMLDGQQIIPAKAVELMVGASYPEQEKAFYCLGLNKRVIDGHVICEHSGGLHGVSSEGGFLKGENYGVTVLCNEGSCDVAELLWAAYNWILGWELDKKHRWLYPKEVPFSAPEMLEGRYICHEGIPVVLHVYAENGQLYADNGSAKMEMVFCGETWFQTRLDGEVIGRLRFHIRNGKAWGVQVYTRVYQRMED